MSRTTTYVIECNGVSSFEEFIGAFNDGLFDSVGAQWNGNLDAFNDLLKWPACGRYCVLLKNASTLPEVLGYGAMAEKLEQMLQTCHKSNVAKMRDELEEAKAGRGPTLFEIILEIIDHNERVSLQLG